jgi:hypothetical protein
MDVDEGTYGGQDIDIHSQVLPVDDDEAIDVPSEDDVR